MSYKQWFYQLCEDVELELIYRLGVSPEELKAIEEYFRVKHDYEHAGGIAYKHGIKKLEEVRTKLMEVVR